MERVRLPLEDPGIWANLHAGRMLLAKDRKIYFRQQCSLCRCQSWQSSGKFWNQRKAPVAAEFKFQRGLTWVQQSLLATGSVEFALLTKRSRYINFGQGDLVIYGDSLPRLKQIKLQWDSEGRFNQFFPITKRPDWCGRIQLVRLVENKNSLLIYQAYRGGSTPSSLWVSLLRRRSTK